MAMGLEDQFRRADLLNSCHLRCTELLENWLSTWLTQISLKSRSEERVPFQTNLIPARWCHRFKLTCCVT